MSNKKKISKKVSTSKHFELNDLQNKNFFLRLENAHLKAQIAIISSQPYKTDYPNGAPEYLNKKNIYKNAGEIGEPEILIGSRRYNTMGLSSQMTLAMSSAFKPNISENKPVNIDQYNISDGIKHQVEEFLSKTDLSKIKYKNSWMEEFKNNPEDRKPFLKYLIDRFNLEVPVPDGFKKNR